MSKTPNSDFAAAPVGPKVKIGRIDQGIDLTQSDPFRAVAAGVVSYIDPNFYKGTPAVYITLDHPVTISGRTYGQVYYSETAALVKTGQRIAPGDPVIAGGSAELGFAAGNLPAAHSVYTEGKVTQAGRDFVAALTAILYMAPQDQTPGTTSTFVNTKTGETSTSKGPEVDTGFFAGLETWLTDKGKLVLAYVMLVFVAGALLVTGLKGLGAPMPKMPAAVPVPV